MAGCGLTTVYGPCQGPDRDEFVQWLNNLHFEEDDNWMIMGDFNFYRSLSDRNKSGGNMNDIMIFNEIISNLGLLEIPLKGRKFTWSNMQDEPLLEQIDWVFTSVNWIFEFPNTLLLPMARPTSDHIPCKIQIGTSIPKAQVFRFENFWVDHPGFFDLVKSVWATEVNAPNSASRISAKFKLLRAALKKWGKKLSNLNNLLKNCNNTLEVLDALEEQRTLFIQEYNFRAILKAHILI
jgi:DNA repair ATPase RecN